MPIDVIKARATPTLKAKERKGISFIRLLSLSFSLSLSLFLVFMCMLNEFNVLLM